MVNGSWGHPSRAVKQMLPVVFVRLADLQQALVRVGVPTPTPTPTLGSGGGEEMRLSWEPLLSSCLRLRPDQKGKYLSLALLVPYVGARAILRGRPAFMSEVVGAVQLNDVSGAAKALLGALLKDLAATRYCC